MRSMPSSVPRKRRALKLWLTETEKQVLVEHLEGILTPSAVSSKTKDFNKDETLRDILAKLRS